MDHHEVASHIFDCHYLQSGAGLVIAEDQHPIGFGRIIGRRLDKGQPAVADDEADLVISYPMLASGVEDPDRQSRNP